MSVRTPVAVLQGRAHYYEHGRADEMKGAIRAMAALGCETLLQTNAAGSLRPDMPPGLADGDLATTSISPASIRCSASRGKRPLRRHGRCL